MTIFKDTSYADHVERRGTDERGNLRRPEALTPEQRRARANAAAAELVGDWLTEEQAAARYDELKQAQDWLDRESGDNSLSSGLWRRVDEDSALVSTDDAAAVADWLGV
jgi:hypothetical protein